MTQQIALTVDIGAVVGVIVTIIGSIAALTWWLSRQLNGISISLSELKGKVNSDSEKLEQMWKWWLATLQNGWIASMKINEVKDGE